MFKQSVRIYPEPTITLSGQENEAIEEILPALLVEPPPTSNQISTTTSYNSPNLDIPLLLSPDQTSNEIEFDTKYFPKLGIKISFIQELIGACSCQCTTTTTTITNDGQSVITATTSTVRGRDAIQEFTSTDMCDRLIMPFTQPYKLSFCELLSQCGHSGVGPAQVFVSHAWRYKFLDVYDALVTFFHDKLDTIVWFDVLSVNQHNRCDKSFEWWSTTFQDAIKEFGHTVMVISPWHNPIPLTRAWCLWELFSTVVKGSRFDIAISKSDRIQFIQDMTKNCNNYLNIMKSTIDVSKSECYSLNDRNNIFQAIEMKITLNELNKVIFDSLRIWILHVLQHDYDISIQTIGLHNLTTLTKGETLALAYQSSGDFSRAFHIQQNIFHYKQLLLTEDHPDTLISMRILASIHQDIGEYELALPLYEKSYMKQKAILGDDHNDTLLTMTQLANLYIDQSDYTKSQVLLEECLKIRQDKYNESHSETIKVMQYLASLYYQLGKDELASSYYQRCYDLTMKVYGEQHPQTISILYEISCFYFDRKSYTKAEELLLYCYDINKTIDGDKHPKTLKILNTLCMLYIQCGRIQEAQLLLEQNQSTMNETTLHDNHPSKLSALHNLGSIQSANKNHFEAYTLFEQCYNKRKQILGELHPDTLLSLEAMANELLYQKKRQDALIVLEQCYEQRKIALGDVTLRTMHLLGDYCRYNGNYHKATIYYEHCYELRKSSLGNNHPDTWQSMNSLGDRYKDQGNYERSLLLYQECYEIKKIALGELHPSTLTNLYHIAVAHYEFYENNDFNFTIPENVLLECIVKQVQVLGIDHRDTIESIKQLLYWYHFMANVDDRYKEKAEEWKAKCPLACQS